MLLASAGSYSGCHPAGDIPLQGDDSHLHTMFPRRGKDGKGVYAMKCSNCHQPTNPLGLSMPPDNPKWALDPAFRYFPSF